MFLTARTTAMVCWLFIGSFTVLGGVRLSRRSRADREIRAGDEPQSPLGFMILAQIIIFVLGWPLEWTEIIVIFMPIFLPLLKTFNVDPLFFGLLVALNIQTSFLSPPVAMAPFYLKGVAPSWVNINDIFRGVMPYLHHRHHLDGACSIPSRRSACGCRTTCIDDDARRRRNQR